MKPLRNIESLTHFKESSRELIEQLKASGQPMVLTVDGEAELVVQAAESYRRLLELVDRAEAIEGVRIGLATMERGEGRPAGEVLGEIRQRYAIPRE